MAWKDTVNRIGLVGRVAGAKSVVHSYEGRGTSLINSIIFLPYRGIPSSTDRTLAIGAIRRGGAFDFHAPIEKPAVRGVDFRNPEVEDGARMIQLRSFSGTEHQAHSAANQRKPACPR